MENAENQIKNKNKIIIEIVYAVNTHSQYVISHEMPKDTTVIEAIINADILQKYPEINLDINLTGIFGVICEHHRILKVGDRIEIYQPLKCDPISSRFKKVARSRKYKKNKYAP